MKTFMISLDKSILNPSSAAADRMRDYGKDQDLFIVVPSIKKLSLQLSESVRVKGTGGGKAVQFFRTVLLGRRLIEEEGIEEITAQDPFFTGLAGICIRARLPGGRAGKKIRLEVQWHGDFLGSDYYRRKGLALFVTGKADTIRVAGERIRQSLVALGISEKKITVRPIAVNEEAIRAYVPKMDLHRAYPQFEKIFLSLSRLDPVKNIPWLVEVFADVVKQHPRAGLVIVGSGSEERAIRDCVKRQQLERSVILEPWTEDPWSYMKTADALLLPSVSEGYGLAVMGAVAVGTPIIMTDVGVANYEVRPGPRVTIVPINDKEQFTQAMQRI